MEPEVFIFFGIGIFLGTLILVHMMNSHKRKIKTHELLEKSNEKGFDITPELLGKLHDNQSSRFKDLRRGVIMGTIGLAVFCFSLVIPADDTAQVFRGLSLLPLFVGIGFILVWKINKYQD